MFCALLHSEGSRAAGGWDFGPTDRVNVTSWLVRRTRQTSKFVGRFFMTILRSISLAVLAATAIGAQASPVSSLGIYQPWETAYTPNGLAGVLFNVNTVAGVGTVALGAHAYKNGVFLPNDGSSVFTAQPGLYEANRANWSFDFGFTIDGACTSCTAWLGIDTDPTTSTSMVFADVTTFSPNPESWNMEMGFIGAASPNGFGYNFNPYASSSTAFSLQIRNGSTVMTQSDITVNVPEPGGLALAGLALAGLALVSRRKA
jgi:hypothetical protein